MLPELEPYIAKYYERWLSYSQQLCHRWRIGREAYDLMADALEDICRKTDDKLLDLLVQEKKGSPKLFFYVRKAIRYEAIYFLKWKYRAMADIEKHAFHLSAVEEDDETGEPSNELREAEAKLRDDSFIVPIATSRIRSSIPPIYAASCKSYMRCGKVFLNVRYEARIPRKKSKDKRILRKSRGAAFTAAIQYQMQQHILPQ